MCISNILYSQTVDLLSNLCVNNRNEKSCQSSWYRQLWCCKIKIFPFFMIIIIILHHALQEKQQQKTPLIPHCRQNDFDKYIFGIYNHFQHFSSFNHSDEQRDEWCHAIVWRKKMGSVNWISNLSRWLWLPFLPFTILNTFVNYRRKTIKLFRFVAL